MTIDTMDPWELHGRIGTLEKEVQTLRLEIHDLRQEKRAAEIERDWGDQALLRATDEANQVLVDAIESAINFLEGRGVLPHERSSDALVFHLREVLGKVLV